MKTKTWLIAALGMILCGGILFGGVMMALNWDFTKLSTVTYETNIHSPGSDFTAIVVETDTANITFVPTDEGCSVTCVDDIRAKHQVYVEDGTLFIINDSSRKWYDHIGIHIGSPKITVRLPQKQYDALTVKAATGNVCTEGGLRFGDVEMRLTTGSITLTDLNAKSLLLQTNTGKVDLSRVICTETAGMVVGTGAIHGKDITCRELVATGGTGNILLVNALAGERLTVTGGTSDVEFIACDAREINVSTTTGNVRGTLRSGKTFDAEANTGRVRVPENSGHGTCHIRTKTGDIHITVE